MAEEIEGDSPFERRVLEALAHQNKAIEGVHECVHKQTDAIRQELRRNVRKTGQMEKRLAANEKATTKLGERIGEADPDDDTKGTGLYGRVGRHERQLRGADQLRERFKGAAAVLAVLAPTVGAILWFLTSAKIKAVFGVP